MGETVVYIGLGSNIGDGLQNLQLAWRLLGNERQISLLALSSPYRSSPVDMDSSFWFTNAVGKISTSLPVEELLATLLEIERGMGRERQLGKDRIIDLDILLYGDACLSTPTVTVPHPEMHRRLFVLAPLCELAPALLHPKFGKTMAELKKSLRESHTEQSIEQSTWS